MIRPIAVDVDTFACMTVCIASLKLALDRYHRAAHLLQTAERGLLGTSRICYRAIAELLLLIQVKTAVVGAAPFRCGSGTRGSIGAAPPAHRCCGRAEGDVSGLCDLWGDGHQIYQSRSKGD